MYFRELRLAELLRIPLPRTPVNKHRRESSRFHRPVLCGGPPLLPPIPLLVALTRARPRGGGPGWLSSRSPRAAPHSFGRGSGRPEPTRRGREESDRRVASGECRHLGFGFERDHQARAPGGGPEGGSRRGAPQGGVSCDYRRGGKAPGWRMSSPSTTTTADAGFRELLTAAELRRIHLPRNRVNKGC